MAIESKLLDLLKIHINYNIFYQTIPMSLMFLRVPT